MANMPLSEMGYVPYVPRKALTVKEQTVHNMKVASVILGIILAIIGFITWTSNWEGSDQCYQDFPNVYSWNYRTAELDAMWADKDLTVGECAKADRIYQESQRIKRQREVEEAVGGKSN